MGLEGVYRLGGDFKAIIWGKATKGWGHFLWRELNPQDTK